MNPFGLNEGDKFALLALESVRSAIGSHKSATLSDGTTAFTELQPIFEGQPLWKEWLGSLRIESLSKANIILLRSTSSSNPQILDKEHHRLGAYLTKLFYLLRLGLAIEYDGADMLVGSFLHGGAQIRQVSEVPGFRPTRGSAPDSVTLDSLEVAADRVGRLGAIESQLPKYARFIRGLNTLVEGLQHEAGQDRIHQFVRSLEALILPDPGRTRNQFVHRCQTFAKAGPAARQVLGEAFDMRSDAEHMHEWDRSLQSCAPNDRENVALQRTRQMERLACFAYSKILDNPALSRQFETDAAQSTFWNDLDDAARVKIVRNQLDLSSILIVRDYDNGGRPVPDSASAFS